MDLNKKYFGMTVTQIGILAGLAVLALVLFCVVGSLVFGKVSGSSAPDAATATLTLQPTVTMVTTPTLTTTPESTPLPYESLIPAGGCSIAQPCSRSGCPPVTRPQKPSMCS